MKSIPPPESICVGMVIQYAQLHPDPNVYPVRGVITDVIKPTGEWKVWKYRALFLDLGFPIDIYYDGFVQGEMTIVEQPV